MQLPALPVPPAEPETVDVERYLGTYACDVAEQVVERDGDGRLWVEQRPKGLMAELGGQVERTELVRLSDDRFVPLKATHGVHLPHVFLGDDGTGHALYIHSGRAIRRVPPTA